MSHALFTSCLVHTQHSRPACWHQTTSCAGAGGDPPTPKRKTGPVQPAAGGPGRARGWGLADSRFPDFTVRRDRWSRSMAALCWEMSRPAQAHVRLLPGCAHATLHLLLRSAVCKGLMQGQQAQRRAEADKGSQCLAARRQMRRELPPSPPLPVAVTPPL